MTTPSRSASASALFLAVMAIAVAFKFWLIWDLEIEDDLADSHEYAVQILHPLIGGIAYPPGTGLVGSVIRATGIPFHLAMEGLYVVALIFVLRALLTWPWLSRVSLGFFLLMLFNPAPSELMSHLMSDQVCMIETMLALSLLVLAWRKPERLDFLPLFVATLLLGLTAITRSIWVPLLAALFVFALAAVAWAVTRPQKSARGPALAFTIFTALILFLGTTLIYYGTAILNSKRHGFYGTSAIDSAEYKTFYLKLQAVGKSDGGPYFPIDENRRNLIATAGPKSREFMAVMEQNAFYKGVGHDLYGVYDLPAGWFHFAVFNTALRLTDGDMLKSLALLQEIEDEIAQAHREGRLPIRTIIPLPDSRVHLVAKTFPGALGHVAAAMIFQPSPVTFANFAERKKLLPEFNAALHRLPVTASPARGDVRWFLAQVYPHLYRRALLKVFVFAALFFLVMLFRRRHLVVQLPPAFVAQQLFGIFFIAFAFWYTLFDASGLTVFKRYVMLQNVLLPLLTFYYLRAALRLERGDGAAFQFDGRG